MAGLPGLATGPTIDERTRAGKPPMAPGAGKPPMAPGAGKPPMEPAYKGGQAAHGTRRKSGQSPAPLLPYQDAAVQPSMRGRQMENGRVVDQTPHPALELIASQLALFRRQGSVVAGWRNYRGRRLGPYHKLAYRHRGRQCSVYLGRSGELVERVRAALKQLQGPLRWFRRFARVRARIKASLRLEKARLDAGLRKLGLYLKGFEPRGWRGSTLRLPGGFAPLTLPTVALARLPNPYFIGRTVRSVRSNR